MRAKNKKNNKNELIRVIQFLVLIMFLVLMNLSLLTNFFEIEGLVTGEVSYSEKLNLSFSKNSTYEIQVNNIPISIRLSGYVIGEGKFAVYVIKDGVEYLILDNKALEKEAPLPLITGYAVLNESLALDENITNESEEINIIEVNVANITTPVNVTNTTINITPQIDIAPERNITDITKPITIIKFNNVCVETCSLFNFTKDIKLVVEVKNVTINLTEITYSYRLIEEGNITINHAPIYSPIPDIVINKNENKIINLSNYFADPDNDILTYLVIKPGNITAITDDNLITLIPDRDFVGNRTIAFIASDLNLTTRSDDVLIRVKETEINITEINITEASELEFPEEEWPEPVAPGELVKRTRTADIFEKDGSNIAIISAGSMNYEKNGRFYPINTKIKEEKKGIKGREFGFVMDENDFEVYFQNSSDYVFRIRDSSVMFSLENTKEVKPVVKNNKILFNDVMPGTDLVYEIDKNRVKEYIILRKAEDNKWIFNLELENAVLEKRSQGIIINDSAGNAIGFIPNPIAFASIGKSKINLGEWLGSLSLSGLDNQKEVDVQLSGNRLTLIIDEEWIKTAQKPVIIDPVIIINNSAITYDGDTTSTVIDSASAFIQTTDTDSGFIDFDTSSIPDGSTINEVNISLNWYGQGTCDGSALDAADDLKYYPMSGKANGNTAANIFTDAANGTVYLTVDGTTIIEDVRYDFPGRYKDPLGTGAATNLQNKLGENWFSVGTSCTSCTAASEDMCYDSVESAKDPQLIVRYTPNPYPGWNSMKRNVSSPLVNKVVMFNITLTDNSGLRGYVFGHNMSGAWNNNTVGKLSGTNTIVSVNLTNTAIQGKNVSYKWYFNDSAKQWNSSAFGYYKVANSAPNIPTIIFPVNRRAYSNITRFDINYTSSDADGYKPLTFYRYINRTFNRSTIKNVSGFNASDGFYALNVSATDGTNFSANASTIYFWYDTQPPKFSGNKTNSSLAQNGKAIQFNITITDAITNLSYWIFSWNGTGVWKNNTNGSIRRLLKVNISANVTITASTGAVIGYKWYANDTANNFNSTVLRTFIVQGSPTVSSVSVKPRKALNGTKINFSATVTDDGTIDDVFVLIYYPNGTNFRNYTMVSGGGNAYYNNTYTSNFVPAGNYTFRIFANDTAGFSNTNTSGKYWFVPYTNLSDSQSITINNNIIDWLGVKNLSDRVGDAANITTGSTVTTRQFKRPMNWSYRFTTSTVRGLENATDKNYNDTTNSAEMVTDTGGGSYVVNYTYDLPNGKTTNVILYFTGTRSVSPGADTWLNISLYNFTADKFKEYYNDTDVPTRTRNITVTSDFINSSGGVIFNINGVGTSTSQVRYRLNDTYITLPGMTYDFKNKTATFKNATETSDADICSNDLTPWCNVIDNKFNADGYKNVNRTDFVYENIAQGAPSEIVFHAFHFAINESIGSITNILIRLDGCYTNNLVGAQETTVYVWNETKTAWLSIGKFRESSNCGTPIQINKIVNFEINSSISDFVDVMNGKNYVHVLAEGAGGGASTETVFTDYVKVDITSTSTGTTTTSGKNYDIKTFSLANDADELFALIKVNGTLDYSNGYYRIFISKNLSVGNWTLPGTSKNVSVKWWYMVESFNATLWRIYNTSDYNFANVTANNASNTIEVAIPLSNISASVSDYYNMSFETGSLTAHYDQAPDYKSFITYRIASVAPDRYPGWSSMKRNVSSPLVNKVVMFNITLTDDSGLRGYVFGHNMSGAWNNNTVGKLSGTNTIVSVNLTNTAIQGKNVSYKWYFNDSAKQWNSSAFGYYKVVNTAPVATLKTPANNIWNNSAIAVLSCNATDADNNLAKLSLWGNFSKSGSGTGWAWNETKTISGGSVRRNFTKTLREGSYKWNCQANDTSASNDFNSNFTLNIDLHAPRFGDNKTNATNVVSGKGYQFNITINDSFAGLSYWKFSWNDTGVWKNSTNGSFTGNSVKVSVNKTVTASSGKTVGYRWYANDTARNWNGSLLTTFTITVSDLYPGWSSMKRNVSSPQVNKVVQFNITLTDDSGLRGYVFGHNMTGTWNNNTKGKTSGTNTIVSVNITNTATRGKNVSYKWYFNDSAKQWNSSLFGYYKVANTLPSAPVLQWPLNRSSATNRSPNYNWSTVTDADGDAVTYQLLVQRISCTSDSCQTDLVNVTNIQYSNYTIIKTLDVDSTYNWSVRTNDSSGYSSWATWRNHTVNSYLSIKLIQANVNFGSKSIGDKDNTTDDAPGPVVVENDGNIYANLSMYANRSLWLRGYAKLNTSYFQYKAGNYTELNSFNWTGSQTNWTNVSSQTRKVIKQLNYNNSKDTGEFELYISVPLDEPGGTKLTGLIIQTIGIIK